MYIPLTSHVRSKTLSLHKKLSLPPSLSFFLPSFLPSSSSFLFSQEYCIHTVIHILPGTRSKQWKKKWPLSSQVTASCIHRSVRFFPSSSFLLFLSIQGRRSSSGRSSILLYIPYVASTMGSKEARNSIARFLLSDIKLPPSLPPSLSLVSSKIIPYCTTSDVSVLRKKERIT